MMSARSPYLVAVFAIAIALPLLPAQTAGSADPSNAPPQTLELGKPLSSELSGGESRDYQFTLEAGQYAHLLIEQKTIDVAVAGFGPDGKQLFEANTNGAGDAEKASLISEVAGLYRIRVRATEMTAPRGEYEIKLVEVQPATEIHKSRIAAERAAAAGIGLYRQQSAGAKREAIQKYEEALAQWRAAKDALEEAMVLITLGTLYRDVGEKQKALDFATQGLEKARATGDKSAEGWALVYLGAVYDYFGDKKKSIEYFEQSLPLWQSTGRRSGELNAINGLGMSYAWLGDRQKGLSYFEQAAALCRELHYQRGEASVLNNMAITYAQMGDYQKAIEMQNQAIALHRRAGNRSGEAVALNNIGTAYANLSEYQKAMDAHTAAFNIAHELGSSLEEAVDLNNIAYVYSTVGDKENALKYYSRSVEICRKVDDRWHLAQALTNLGAAYADLQDYDQALKIFSEALVLHRVNGNRTGEGNTLKSLAATYGKLGDQEKALDYDRQALAILRATQDRRLLAETLRNMGSVSRKIGERQRAMEDLNEAFAISGPIGDRRGEAESLGEIAHVELDQGDFKEARSHSDNALAVFDSLRSTITNPKLRAWFSQAVRKVHEVNLQALFRLHQQQPTAGYDAAALLAAEKGRAQALLELLGESQARIREGVDPVLLDRELSLRRTIAAKAQVQERLLAGKHSDEQAGAAAKELDELTRDYDQLQSAIREKSPAYAALTMPVPLSLAGIQHEVVDNETLLLEYMLGEEKSLLFAVTPTSLSSFELPERKTIEAAARRVYYLITVRRQVVPGETLEQRTARLRRAEAEYPAAAARLSQMLLGPVAPQLGGKRLLVVAEGVLQYVPFNALPEPQKNSSSKPRLLIAGHEIVTAPSASVLSLLRSDAAQRRPADKQLAVLADPVFDGRDSRVSRGEKTPASSPVPTDAAADVLRSGGESGLQLFVRLRFSRQEAERIARFADGSRKLTALDFAASRTTAVSPELAQYRIVHFATHGLINNQHPELSGLVLSLVNEQGQEVDGFLRLYDIYNLRLGADLVVLSACQTALGKEIAGEGLIGLTRGFVYAGVPRVVASLWQVDDRVTAELMENFYQAMLTRNERPAAALRMAQLAISQARGWESPFYWAAFTLQGEWR